MPSVPDNNASPPQLSVYDRHATYDDNYAAAPSIVPVQVVEFPGEYSLAGMSLPSPLGVAAGPLLNGAWCQYYAQLGFDWVTYKTVRSRPRECYPLPNLQPVDCPEPLLTSGEAVKAVSEDRDTWAVSFGMPSRAPEVWRADVQATRAQLPPHVRLSVSIVGSMQADWSLDDLAEDYAQCARGAVASDADAVEANFSCPNVATCDGQLYQIPRDARLVAERIRQAIPDCPLLVKIGFVPTLEETRRLVDALAGSVDVLVMTNSLAAQVRRADREWLFDGAPRGICGAAIREASLQQVERFRRVVEQTDAPLELVGVGGVFSAADVRQYLDAGAATVQLATAIMRQPDVGLRIRREFAEG